MKKFILTLTLTMAAMCASCAKKDSHGSYCTETIGGTAPEYQVSVDTMFTPFFTQELRNNCLYAARWPEVEDLQYKVAYSVHFHGLKQGDVIQYAADLWAKSESTGSVLFAGFVNTSTVGPNDPNATSNHLLCATDPLACRHQADFGHNIGIGDHYTDVTNTGVIVIEQDIQDLYLNVVVYAGYSKAVGGDAEFLQLSNNGGFSGVVFRADAAAVEHCKAKPHHQECRDEH